MARPRDLSGRVVAITGGARGIGRATATLLADRGARIGIGDLDETLAREVATGLGERSVGLRLDVTDRASFEAFLDAAEAELGPLYALINNAGIMPIGAFGSEEDATTRLMLDVNLMGVIHGTKLAIGRLVPRGEGHIVNVASQAGKVGIPGAATYCASKHAVVGLSEAVRQELRKTGVEVSCVMPAAVNTELIAGLNPSRLALLVSKQLEPRDVAREIERTLRRPQFEVYVPPRAKVTFALTALTPRRLREALGRALGSERVLFDYDRAGRAAYLERISGDRDPVGG
jgi:NAD(P)-dependent dehydrogenase (short-subunit alcohol dehydrogenase family)